ncbi:hypothetical protein EVJ58_g4603 [Rhodofomes roseus]|uniref:Uncharacterized protein n=1 Tax=Rhodofomes roseus TaxID=34475 RepID=A0A4Y9YFZ7_9APHY|nr:hypothetical protein EVJ58_g4603 [Rhodofomes roseus]
MPTQFVSQASESRPDRSTSAIDLEGPARSYVHVNESVSLPLEPIKEAEAVRASSSQGRRRETPHIDLLRPPPLKRVATKTASRSRQDAPADTNAAKIRPPLRSSQMLQPDIPTERSSPAFLLPSSTASSPPLTCSPSNDTPSVSSQAPSRLSTPASNATSLYASSAPPPSSPSPSSSTQPDSTPTPSVRASAPRIPYVMKGKERMPDFRTLISGLRAAGKLNGPPALDPEVVQSDQKDADSLSDQESTPRPSVSGRSARYDTHDIDDLYATPPPTSESSRSRGRYDTHDIDDMYATPQPELRNVRADTHNIDDMYAEPALPARATRPPSRYDTHDIDDMYATPAPESIRASKPATASRSMDARKDSRTPQRPSVPELRLVFDWQNERFPNGRGDAVSAILEHRMERIELRKAEYEPRKPRKVAATQRLGNKDKRRKEDEVLVFQTA